MDVIYHGIGVFLSWVLPFLFVLSLVVFFHELGHFLVARWCGVRVLVFSIGFGKELFGFNDRSGTRWKISAVPLGGYVKFFGDENAASMPDAAAAEAMSAAEREVSFPHKPIGARASVVAAGPIANFIVAIVIIAGIAWLYGVRAASLSMDPSPRIDEIVADYPAAKVGFAPGDIVRSINGEPVNTFADMQKIVSRSEGHELHVMINREGQSLAIDVSPIESPDKKGAFVLGIKHSPLIADQRVGPAGALWFAVSETWATISNTLWGIEGIFTGRESSGDLGGVGTIAVASAQAAAHGFTELLRLAAFLSISIGLLNLFPIPVLDGGHLLFYAIEAVRGRPLSERTQEVGFRIGLAIVLVLTVFATKNDIMRFLIK
jgi:regulator of sigma E protease